MSDTPIPPASFELLVFAFRMQAEQALGLIHLPDENSEVNVPMARHAIDMLAVIEEKTRGNLSLEEKRLIENTLTELRFRVIQAGT